MSKSSIVLMAYDQVEIGKPEIVSENNRFLKVRATISRVGVYKYDDGMAFKCAPELRKATRTARYAKITLNDHPASKVIMSQADVFGGVEKPVFTEDRIRAILSFEKEVVPEAHLKLIRNGDLKDVSIGFYYRPDFTSGWHRDVNTDKPTHYDYIMRDIMIDHVVAGVAAGMQGRCRFPQCGIGVDTVMKRISIGEDKVEKRGNQWCVIHCHGPDAGKPIKCFPTKAKAEAMHRAIQARKRASAQDLFTELSYMGLDASILDAESHRLLFGDAEQPSKAWMDNCKAKAAKFADDPGAFCGWVWYHGPGALKASFGASSDVKMKEKTTDQEEKTPYQKCVDKNVEEGMTEEEAKEACQEKKTDQEKLQSAYDKCLVEKKGEGMTDEEAQKACEALKPTAEDQEETPWQKCIATEMAKPDMTMEKAVAACKAKGLGQKKEDQEPLKVEEPAPPQEVLPTPLEACVATRMETHGEDEATAKKVCEAELAGQNQPAQEIVDSIKELRKTERRLNKRK